MNDTNQTLNVSESESDKSIKLCPCGSGEDLLSCCGPLHAGESHALTAEVLMRSRYSAYVLRNRDYLLATWEASKRPIDIDFSKEQDIVWKDLHIVSTKKGGVKDSKGIVEFKARYAQKHEEYVMHEISRFVKKDGRWFYFDGVVKAVGKGGQPVNEGKNAPCPCGSGKKFKRCCGK